jgi:hypothetical protein
MPEPLKRKQKNGTPYERPPEIEAWLTRLEMVDAGERVRQFSVTSKKKPGYVPSEVLVHFMRQAWRGGAKKDFEAIFRFVMERSAGRLASAIPDFRMAGASGIREEILARFAERIAKDCKGRTGLLDFFEVRFDKAFAALRTSVLRQIGPANLEEVPLGTEGEDGTEISAEVEVAAAGFLSGDLQKIDDPAFRSELFAAIDCLPNDQKQVIGLLLQGFPIDSKDDSVLTIARILGCDERTVRNRRDRACKALKAILQVENAQ